MIEFSPLFFIFGLIVGSFLNVLILRFKAGEFVFSMKNIKGRSKCPDCGAKLRWFELVPLVSFLFQKGKCRRCGNSISWQYPIVEFLAGAVCVAVPWFFYNFYNIASLGFGVDNILVYLLTAVWVLILFIFILITWIDIKHFLIPDDLNISLLGLGGGVVVLKSLISSSALPFTDSFLGHFQMIFFSVDSLFLTHLLGAGVALAFFLLVMFVSRGKALGGGDVKLAFAGGFIFGWPDIVLALAIAFVIGGIAGAFSMLFKGKKMKDHLPFGPFLVLGMVLTLFFGTKILEGYFSFMGI